MTTTVLVTGGCGFIGHHFCEHVLKNTDWDIVVLDSITYAGSLSRIVGIDLLDQGRLRFVWHDLRSALNETVVRMIGHVDYIVHFAAETHVDRSLEDAVPFVMTNVLGTLNLLNYVRRSQPQAKTAVISTDEVFGPSSGGAFGEEDRFRPSNPYAASKAGAEMLAYSYAYSFKLPIFVVRMVNCFGERQNKEKFVPKTIKRLVSNKKVVIHGYSKKDCASRSWIHARDASDGILFLLGKATPTEFYHLAGEEWSVYDIADVIHQEVTGLPLTDEEVEYVPYETARVGCDKRYVLSGVKVMSLGWCPTVGVEESLRKVVRWTLKHKNWLY
ncbi:NAD-dependent epimerase [Candidatus Bathyarchaeota archaeon]|nr:MAG: NAD-dependent epimerase [Candidatus Bathyarchaeota archaeon]